MSYSLGIDIGTTFVAAALARASTTQMIPLGNRLVVVPAAVYLRSNGTLAAGEAVGLPAVGGQDRICGELMSRLGDPTPVLLGGRPYEITAMLGLLLGEVVQTATQTQGDSPDHIVLTHPVTWGPFRCALLGEVARQAGLAKPGLVTEPEAAVAHYTASRALHDGETVAVYHLGGTYTMTVLRQQFGRTQIIGEPQNRDRDPSEHPIRVLAETLRAAQIEPAELTSVLLVGRSPHIPLVARMVPEELGCPAVVDSHPQHVVALGAARLAAQTVPHRPVHDGEPAGSVLRPPARPVPAPVPRTPEPEVAAPVTAAPPAPSPLLESPVPENPAPEHPVPIENRLPHRHHGRAAARASRSVNRGRAPRILLGTGVAVALTGMILLAILGGRLGAPTAVPSVTPPAAKAEPTAVTEVGRQIGIPAVGATIRVERSPGFVTVSPDGQRAYTANLDAQVLTVVDTALNRVVATIPIAGGPPQFLRFAPDGRTLYISMFNEARTIHAIGVLDTASNTVIATIPQQGRPYPPAVSSDGTRLYVPNHDIASVSVIDTATNTVIGQIAVPPNPHGVDFSPDGSRAYTANHESNVVSVIDTATRAVRKTIPVGTSPHSIAVNPRRPLVAATNFDSNSVSVIDTSTEQVVATIPVGENPQDIAWAPDGRLAYVVNHGSNSVSVIDAATNQVTATLPTGAGPTSIAVLPDGRHAHISNLDSGTVTVLDLPN